MTISPPSKLDGVVVRLRAGEPAVLGERGEVTMYARTEGMRQSSARPTVTFTMRCSPAAARIAAMSGPPARGRPPAQGRG